MTAGFSTPPAAGSVLLVEGESDRAAVQALAARRGVDLAKSGVELVVLGGAQAIGPYLRGYRARGDRRRLSGLYDVGERAVFGRALRRHGVGGGEGDGSGVGFGFGGSEGPGPDELEALGFFCCELDLEDELIRALGAPAVCAVIAAHGDASAFHTLQHQPQWRGRPVEAQLRRFMGSGARRKIRYGRLLVDALDLDRLPRPLDAVLQAALSPGDRRLTA